jgi:hypothetical protein
LAKKKKNKTRKISKKAAKAKLEGLNASNLLQNEDISNYISQNPAPDELSVFGKPQDKNRYGSYGLGTKEFDTWGGSGESNKNS